MTQRATHDKWTPTDLPPTEQERTALMDEESWDWDSTVVGFPEENPALELGIVLDFNEARVLGEAARAANMPMNQYIKQAALAAARSAKV